MTVLVSMHMDKHTSDGYILIIREVVKMCVGSRGGADGRALVMTFGILYSVMRVEGTILVEATLSQFP